MSSNIAKRKCETVLKEIEDEKLLVDAAKNGNFEEAKRLLQCGVSVDSSEYNKQLFYQSENYMTPLHFSTSMGFPNLVRIFIEYGADVDARDRFDVTALHTAADLGREECLQLLLEGGADCNISTKYSKHGSYTAVPHPGGTTPLHLAAVNNHVGCVRLLIWNGADYNAVDEKCRTSLFLAAQKGFGSCVHAHLDNAIWKDILSLPEKCLGDTPLHECVVNNMLDCVTKLLSRGSDVNHLNTAGLSPLLLAVRARDSFSINILKELIKKGYNTDVNQAEPKSLSTPLHYVCFNDTIHQERRQEAAALLIAYGANFNIRNKHGESLLRSELRGRHKDTTILCAIAKCTAHLPSLESLGFGVTLSSSNPVPNPAAFHQRQQLFASLCSDVQQFKIAWYKDVLKGPRTLQHYCRCVIRDTMGVQRLRKIDTLPLPTTLKEYLLLELEEFSSSSTILSNV